MKNLFPKLHLASACLALAAFAIGPLLAYFELAPALVGFGLYSLGSLASVLVAGVSLVQAFRRGSKLSLIAGALAVGPAVFLVYLLASAREYPAINDISTETIYPPRFVHAATLPENEGRTMTLPEDAGEIIRASYPEIHTLAVNRPADQVFELLLELARAQEGWTITDTRPAEKESIFEAYATTRVFRFKDDIVVRVTKVEEESCVVDMRSKSRDGKGDLGANAERIRSFLAKVAQ